MNKKRIVSLGIVVVLVVSSIAVMLSGCKKDKGNDVIDTPIETATPTPNVEVTPTPKPNLATNEINNITKYSYENDMIGIKFNHSHDFYSKENIEEVFNTISDIIPEDRDTFNIYTDKLNDSLRLLDLSANDNVHITVSLIPFEIDKETTTIKLDGSKDVSNEAIDSVDLSDEDLVAKMDEQIRAGIEELGCEIVSFDGSEVRNIGKNAEGGTVRAVITNRTYTGDPENTTSTGYAEIYQCTIPVGRNAVVITLLSDGEETTIDKVATFEEIINSFVVTTAAPVEETEEVEGEDTPAE